MSYLRLNSSIGASHPSIELASNDQYGARVHWDLTASNTGVTEPAVMNPHRGKRGRHRCTPMKAPFITPPCQEPDFGSTSVVTSVAPLVEAKRKLGESSTTCTGHDLCSGQLNIVKSQLRSYQTQATQTELTTPVCSGLTNHTSHSEPLETDVSGNQPHSPDIAIKVLKLPKANTGYLSKSSDADMYATSQSHDLSFPALGQPPCAPCTQLRGLQGKLENHERHALEPISLCKWPGSQPVPTYAMVLRTPVKVQTSSVPAMRVELNRLQRALCQGLTNLDDLTYRSTSAKGDFVIQHAPMHCDNPKKASRRARLCTTMMLGRASNPSVLAQPAMDNSSTPDGPQNGTLGLRGKKPQETIVNSTDTNNGSDGTDTPSVQTDERGSRLKTYQPRGPYADTNMLKCTFGEPGHTGPTSFPLGKELTALSTDSLLNGTQQGHHAELSS